MSKLSSEILKNVPDLSGRKAVALETTVLTHGMPYPQNVQCALECEEEVRKAGAEPYTIGIIKGQIKIGLTKDEIIDLGKTSYHDAVKCSRRDLAFCIERGLTGSTTVSATMILAHLANIKIFATGGIGGVHRGYAETLDLSADLDEFSKTPINVVCSGPKAILDIPKTIEYLETKGIAIVGYKTRTLPLFYTSTSPYKLEAYADTPEEIARMINVNDALGLKQGTLIVNPIPEGYSLDPEYVERKIQGAIAEMKARNIQGKDVTPFLLDRLVDMTDGKSLFSNMALIRNNAHLAGEIAASLV